MGAVNSYATFSGTTTADGGAAPDDAALASIRRDANGSAATCIAGRFAEQLQHGNAVWLRSRAMCVARGVQRSFAASWRQFFSYGSISVLPLRVHWDSGSSLLVFFAFSQCLDSSASLGRRCTWWCSL